VSKNQSRTQQQGKLPVILAAALVWISGFVAATPAAAQTDAPRESPVATLAPVPCMSLTEEGIEALYSNMKDVVLSIQVCVSESSFTDAAELYFITWPFMSFNQEATRNDQLNNAYIDALDASLRHYFAEMSEADQDALLNEFDAIVSESDNRARMCAHLTNSPAPFVDIRQQAQAAIQMPEAESVWEQIVLDYGCS